MTAVQEIKKQLEPGYIYRREDLSQWSNAVDRHLSQLQKDQTLIKLSGGMYYYPRKTVFGLAPPEEKHLIESFLKDKRFLLMNPHLYNSLGLSTTQLYNATFVYNHKRHGKFRLGGRDYRFIRKNHFPKEMTPEFLFVDLMDNLHKLAEDKGKVQELAYKKALSMDRKVLLSAIHHYGGVKAKNFFSRVFHDGNLKYGA